MKTDARYRGHDGVGCVRFIQFLRDDFLMPAVNAAYLERQLKRWMRPDAFQFVRADWRMFARPGTEDDYPFALYERKYRPDQPRVPAGSREGGQWTEEGGGDESAIPSNARPTQHRVDGENIGRSSTSGRANGHHYVPRAVLKDLKISDEARKVFETAKTGKLYDLRSNQWDLYHRQYSKAVKELLKEHLVKNGIRPEKMTGAQAYEFLPRLFGSTDSRIKDYNLGIQMRELMQRLLRRGGRE
jgi:hypothetical protein